MENKKNTLNIALLGYGKMGREIEQIALAQGHKLVLIIDHEKDWIENEHILSDADVAIDFSMPQTAAGNIEKCFAANVPIVVGTTGWYADFDRIKNIALKKNQSLFYATNFSLGVNIFSTINSKLAQIMNRFPNYAVRMSETHHTQKLDAPSGTAISLAQGIINEVERIENWKLVNSPSEEISTNLLPIEAHRIDQVPGTHEIVYFSDVDEIRMVHEAKNRKGFAKGAVLAAEWLVGKKGIFTMRDFLNL